MHESEYWVDEATRRVVEKNFGVTRGRPSPFIMLFWSFWGSGGCRSHDEGGT